MSTQHQHRDGEIVRDATGAAVALLLSSTLPPCAPDSSAKFSRCLRVGCSGVVEPQRVRRGREKRYCSDRCAKMAWNEAHPRLGTQQALDFTPPVARADDAQAARLQRKALALLEALQAGPLTNVEAMRIGGLRFGARLHELRRAKYRIETEEHKDTGVTVYRLEATA